jgi:hypothetical protein
MICCAICGLIELNHQLEHFQKLNSMCNNLNINEFGFKIIALLIVYYLIYDYFKWKGDKDLFKMLY